MFLFLRCPTKELIEILLEHIGSKRGGSTSTVAVIVGDELYIGHLGDSRAVLGISDTDNSTSVHPNRVSVDHVPEDPKERQRVSRRGDAFKAI